MEIIRERESREDVEYCLECLWADDPGAGFSFACDENGVLLPMHATAEDNYRKCKDGEYDVIFMGMSRRVHRYTMPAVGRCACGREVSLGRFTNACSCGRDYDSNGSLLAPRHQWGEETGEHWTECV